MTPTAGGAAMEASVPWERTRGERSQSCKKFHFPYVAHVWIYLGELARGSRWDHASVSEGAADVRRHNSSSILTIPGGRMWTLCHALPAKQTVNGVRNDREEARHRRGVWMTARIPVIVIDDTPIKRRGVCDFVEETPRLQLGGQAGNGAESIRFIKGVLARTQNSTLAGWLVLCDLRLGDENGIELGRSLLELASGLKIVIYTQDPSWTLAAEVFRQEYTRRGPAWHLGIRTGPPSGLHGYALFQHLEPVYLERMIALLIDHHKTFIDAEVLDHLLKRLRGQQLTPRQEECAALLASGLSNDEIALRMGFLTAKGEPNLGPLENLVGELYRFFSRAVKQA
jgi:DNA-binding NarL/FixJ family response regulator